MRRRGLNHRGVAVFGGLFYFIAKFQYDITGQKHTEEW
jgi:hypothetical protein